MAEKVARNVDAVVGDGGAIPLREVVCESQRSVPLRKPSFSNIQVRVRHTGYADAIRKHPYMKSEWGTA